MLYRYILEAKMNLKRWMREQGMTQEGLATHLGVKQSTISRLLSRQLYPSPSLMRRIHEVTGGQVTPNDLIGMNCPMDTPRPTPSANSRECGEAA